MKESGRVGREDGSVHVWTGRGECMCGQGGGSACVGREEGVHVWAGRRECMCGQGGGSACVGREEGVHVWALITHNILITKSDYCCNIKAQSNDYSVIFCLIIQ